MIKTHARPIYIGTSAERAATTLSADAQGAIWFDTDLSIQFVWAGSAWQDAGGNSKPYRLWESDGGGPVVEVDADGNISINGAQDDRDLTINRDGGVALFMQGSDGFIGIRHTSPTSPLHLIDNYSASTPRTAAVIAQTWSPSTTPGSVFPTTMTLTPIYDSTHSPSGGFLTSFRLFAEIEDSGVLSIRNIDMLSTNDGSGTVTSIHDIHLRSVVNSGGGAITEYTGLLIEASTAAVTNYGVRQQGSGMINSFAGKTGIGAIPDSVSAPLQVHGSLGGWRYFEASGVGTTAVEIVPNGSPDVTTRVYFDYVLYNGSASASGSIGLTNGATTTVTIAGTEIWTFRVNANGSFDVRRTAGSTTAIIIVECIYS